jgi:hypothetical protein
VCDRGQETERQPPDPTIADLPDEVDGLLELREGASGFFKK